MTTIFFSVAVSPQNWSKNVCVETTNLIRVQSYSDYCSTDSIFTVSAAAETDSLRPFAVERGLLTDSYSFPNHQFSLESDELLETYGKEISNSLDYFDKLRGVVKEMNEVLAYGLCFGMAATTVLTHNGVISPNEIQQGAKSLREITLTDDVECLIGKYAIIQSYPKFNYYMGWQKVSHSYDEQIDILLKTAESCEANKTYFLINIDHPSGGHAVVGMGLIQGQWIWNDIEYDLCVLTNDSNLQNAAGKAIGFSETGCIYVNSKTKQFYIPCYEASTENGSTIPFVTGDTELLSYRAPLHRTSDAMAFDNSSGCSKLTFWYNNGRALPDILASKDNGKNFYSVLDSVSGALVGSNRLDLFSEGNYFKILTGNIDHSTNLAIYSEDYISRIECQPGCDITIDNNQISVENTSENACGLVMYEIFDESRLSADYPKAFAGVKLAFTDTIQPAERVSLTFKSNGYELITTAESFWGNLSSHTGNLVKEIPYFEGNVYVTGSEEKGTKVFFTYNEKANTFEQNLDRDYDGVYETQIEYGDSNGDGIPFDLLDAMIVLKDYVKRLSKDPYRIVNVTLSDMNLENIFISSPFQVENEKTGLSQCHFHE